MPPVIKAFVIMALILIEFVVVGFTIECPREAWRAGDKFDAVMMGMLGLILVLLSTSLLIRQIFIQT